MNMVVEVLERFTRVRSFSPRVVLAAGLIATPGFALALDIMPLGDSITQGYTSPGESIACGYRTPLVEGFGNCSVSLVGSLSTPYQNSNGGSCVSSNVNHEGHAGYSTSNFTDTSQAFTNGLSRNRYWLNLNTPDVVLLHIGTNDMGNGTGSFGVGQYDTATNTGTLTIGRISQMIDEVYLENSNAKVFVADLIPYYRAPAEVNTRIGQLRSQIVTMVADRAGDGDVIQLVNVSSGFQTSMMQVDGIHPNASGETHIAKGFLSSLHQNGICTPTLQITSPGTGSLQGSTQSFVWQQDNMDSGRITNWELKAGSSAGASNYAQISGTGSATQGTLTGLPTNGQTVYVTVRIKYFTGDWFDVTRTYTASGGGNEFCNGKAVTVYIENGDTATSGDDVILGTSGMDVIYAMGGNDTICGLGGADTIYAGNGNDWVDAGAGDDEVQGSNGTDVIYGSAGNDDLFGGPGNDVINGDAGNDTIYGNSGSDEIDGGDGIDDIRGGSGNDVITTGTGATVNTSSYVDGGAGNDTITGGADADLIRGSTDKDTIAGGGGNDQLFGGGGEDEIDGQDGNDFIRGNAANDVLYGGNGSDDIDGGASKDLIRGGNDNDTLAGRTGNDEVHGDAGNDILTGDGGNDRLYGDAGNDDIEGGGSNDFMDGGSGSSDTCDGGSGIDTATACESVTGVP